MASVAGMTVQKKRSQITRAALLRAAREVFAAEGFEHARIEDIAARSGRTRGAFYANFIDKEDVFFALFEEDLGFDIEHLDQLMQCSVNQQQRIFKLEEYLKSLNEDHQRTLLYLEFKLYAIRHRNQGKRLANLHELLCARCAMPKLEAEGPDETVRLPGVLPRALAISAIMDGLALNKLFNPKGLDDRCFSHYFNLCVNEGLMSESTQEAC